MKPREEAQEPARDEPVEGPLGQGRHNSRLGCKIGPRNFRKGSKAVIRSLPEPDLRALSTNLRRVLRYDVPTDATSLKHLVETELASVGDERVIAHVRPLLVEPYVTARRWDYGAPGQTYPCWTILDDAATSETGIVYCEFGFGPRCPWGLVFMRRGALESMGMDSGWFDSFIEAFFDSFAATRLSIWRVFQRDEPTSTALTGESSWEEAWSRCREMRELNPDSKYLVHHSVGRLETSR